MSFWSSNFRLLMEVSFVIVFECETIKHWNISSKVKIISKNIASWDAWISNYTTTVSPQGSVGCDSMCICIAYSPFCRYGPHMKRT